jgi:hypothetical protein
MSLVGRAYLQGLGVKSAFLELRSVECWARVLMLRLSIVAGMCQLDCDMLAKPCRPSPAGSCFVIAVAGPVYN